MAREPELANKRRRIPLVIVHRYHGRIKDHPQGSRICRSGPGNAGKDDPDNDRYNCEPPWNGTDEKTDQAESAVSISRTCPG